MKMLKRVIHFFQSRCGHHRRGVNNDPYRDVDYSSDPVTAELVNNLSEAATHDHTRQ